VRRTTTLAFVCSIAAAACIDPAGETDDQTASSESSLRWWPPPPRIILCPLDPPSVYEQPFINEAPTASIILHDSDVFWAHKVADIGLTADDEYNFVRNNLASPLGILGTDAWYIGRRAMALVHMYDLLAPIDTCRAGFYLERLRRLASALLDSRDDKRTTPPYQPIDGLRNQVMAAWGGRPTSSAMWTTSAVIAGLYTYPMAAFARRVATNPNAFGTTYQQDAIRFTTAVMQTYISFYDEMVISESHGWGYYTVPNSSVPISWNENLSLMKAYTEAAIAADSSLYRSSPATAEWSATLNYMTREAPRLVANNVKFFIQNLSTRTWSGDNARYYFWNHEYAPTGQVQNTPHAQFELDSLTLIYENQALLDGLLYRAGRPERIGLSASILQPFATTFLRRIWTYNYSNPSLQNVLDKHVDGSGHVYVNQECAGFVPLSRIDPWVWVRCHDSAFKEANKREDVWAALLRYR
jgi:hypothetical protein